MLAVVFPGQGSQAPGMGKAFYEAGGAGREVFDQVSSAVGFDIAALCFNSDEDTLRQTQNAGEPSFPGRIGCWNVVQAFRPAGIRRTLPSPSPSANSVGAGDQGVSRCADN